MRSSIYSNIYERILQDIMCSACEELRSAVNADAIRQENERLKKDKKGLEMALRSSEGIIDNQVRRFQELREEKNKLARENERLIKANEAADRTKTYYRTRLEVLSKGLDEARREKLNLLDQINTLKAPRVTFDISSYENSVRIESLRVQVLRLENQLAAEQERVVLLQSDLTKAHRRAAGAAKYINDHFSDSVAIAATTVAVGSDNESS